VRLQQLQQTMDESLISSSSATATDAGVTDAGSKRDQLSVVVASQGPACCSDLPLKPVWMMEDSLLVYSPPGLRASDKVAHQYNDFHTPGHYLFERHNLVLLRAGTGQPSCLSPTCIQPAQTQLCLRKFVEFRIFGLSVCMYAR